MTAQICFDGKAFLVTGAGRGLGRAQAILLARRGARIVVADNGSAMDGNAASGGPAAAVVEEIGAQGGTAVACTADLACEAGAEQAVAASLDAFGRIDGIAHYASTCPPLTSPDRIDGPDMELLLAINPLAAIRMTRAAWPHMARQGHGRLLFTPSAGIYGALGSAHYATAKSAYLGLVRCLALDGRAQGILVNALMPAAQTRMTEGFPPGAFADWFQATMLPEKVAAAGAWLLSDDCAITGETFAVGGGRIARVTIAETEGVVIPDISVERAGGAMPQVMADERFFYPRDLSERSGRVARVFGFAGGGLDTSSAHAIGEKIED